MLDEPTSGLDPRGMKDVRELIRDLGAAGTTVFLSSHLLHEVEQVCTRAVIINRGRVVVQGPVSELRPQAPRPSRCSPATSGAPARRCAPASARPASTEDEGYLVVKADEDGVPEMVRAPRADGVDVRAVVPARSRAWRTSSSSSRRTRRETGRRGEAARRPVPRPARRPAMPAPHGRTAAPRRRAGRPAWGALRREWIEAALPAPQLPDLGRRLADPVPDLPRPPPGRRHPTGGRRPAVHLAVLRQRHVRHRWRRCPRCCRSCCPWPPPWSPAT